MGAEGQREEELVRPPFLAVGRDSSVHRPTGAAFARIGARTAPAAEAAGVATVGGLVAAGLGVSAVPALVLPLMAAGSVVRRPLVGPVVDGRLDVVSHARRALPVVARRFLETPGGFRERGGELPSGVHWT